MRKIFAQALQQADKLDAAVTKHLAGGPGGPGGAGGTGANQQDYYVVTQVTGRPWPAWTCVDALVLAHIQARQPPYALLCASPRVSPAAACAAV